jgi:enoyl reductase-like protein
MARLNTRITSLFGIRHPIILPGMSWISKPELVAAVSNAGGLGILATGPLTGEPPFHAKGLTYPLQWVWSAGPINGLTLNILLAHDS